MERVDITRLLDDSFLSDDDCIDSRVKLDIYKRACIETENDFKKIGFPNTPCTQAQIVILKYNKYLKEYEDGKK